MAIRAWCVLLLVLWLSLCSCRRRQRLKVRLQGGTQAYAGRVQVFYRGVWGGICDNGWSKKNAEVVCRQLGYKYRGVVLFTTRGFYGRQGTRRIWLDQVRCYGRERNIGQCRHKPIGRIRCNVYRVAGVMCDPPMRFLVKQPPLAKATNSLDIKLFKVKLMSEQKQEIVTEGLLGVKYSNGNWGAVCSDDWDTKDARVACGELGFTNAVDNAIPASSAPNVTWKNNYMLTRLKCTGTEASLLSCRSTGLGSHYCKSGLPVMLKCKTSVANQVRVRLRGGVFPSEGRVEILPGRYRAQWGTICDKNMNINTANVICRTLGYGTAYEYTMGTVFPHGISKDIYEDVKCTGTEWFLEQCRWRLRGRKYPCMHYSDAGVRCNVPKRNPKNPIEVRIAGGYRPNSGRVEVKVGGKWGMICGYHWTMKNTMVVCREAGFGYGYRNHSYTEFGRLPETLLSGVTCFGNETSLDQCFRHSLDNITCSTRNRVAGVTCSKVIPDLVWDIKELQKTMQFRSFQLATLQCAYEENCLSSSAAAVYDTTSRWHNYRRLLRFSAKIHNVGTRSYMPIKAKSQWQWHSCHRHFHSDEEFAIYDVINNNHVKVAEGHKASYCLEDTKCDPGVEQFFNCTGGGDQGISVNCHDNYDFTLDCQWVDMTDLPYRPPRHYNLRLVANPSFKVGEADYTNNVAMCRFTDLGNRVHRRCFLENCKSGVRSHHGTGNFACCWFPFYYRGKVHNTCIEDEKTRRFWCGTTAHVDSHGLWGYC